MDYLRELATESLGRLLIRTADLGVDDRTWVVKDFERGRAKLMEVFEAKLCHWRFLPHKLCCLGYSTFEGTCEDSARVGLRECIGMYQGLAAEDRDSMWPIVEYVCSPESPLHGEVDAFLGGRALADLPGLLLVAAKMLAIPCLRQEYRGAAQA